MFKYCKTYLLGTLNDNSNYPYDNRDEIEYFKENFMPKILHLYEGKGREAYFFYKWRLVITE